MSIATGDGNESQPSIHTSSTDYTSSTNYTSSSTYNAFPHQLSQVVQPCRPFEYHEILSATENFDESLVIGHGGFGKVYKANLVNGSSHVSAAIKRLDSVSTQGAHEFRAEVEILSGVRHTHLVPLIGYCDYGNEMILVYEYMPNGTLRDHLHELSTPLSWLQRLRICIGAARALDYLHSGAGIIHRDVKSANILLNISWEPKISDFGISKIITADHELNSYVSTQVKGTFGYLDPEYFHTGMLTRKSDVYAFGVVLLEVLCRKKALDKRLGDDEWGLVNWALRVIKEGGLKHIVDSNIRDEISPKCLKGFVQIAERCLDSRPRHRPTMADVLSTLEFILNLQEKTSNFMQIARKTVFGRLANRFSIITKGKISGMESEFRMPKKSKLLMLREKILQQLGALSSKEDSEKFLHLKPNCFGSVKIFGTKELEEATNSYAEDMILGKGAQGIVYKGMLPDKRVVAIKSLRIPSQRRLEQFITEIAILEQINHKNVVQLLGCCFRTDDALLVYECVSNGSLHHVIHNRTSGALRLSWDSRLRIAHESAEALDYLHTYATVSIVHRDVKCANILLDENYTAKISDFGSSRLIPLEHGQITAEVEGTLGYMDPEYFHTYKLTCKTDVYGFGRTLKPIDMKRADDVRLSTETKENRLCEVIDPQVLEEATDEQLKAACDLVYRCLEPLGRDRPSMKEVRMKLAIIRRLGKHLSVE